MTGGEVGRRVAEEIDPQKGETAAMIASRHAQHFLHQGVDVIDGLATRVERRGGGMNGFRRDCHNGGSFSRIAAHTHPDGSIMAGAGELVYSHSELCDRRHNGGRE